MDLCCIVHNVYFINVKKDTVYKQVCVYQVRGAG